MGRLSRGDSSGPGRPPTAPASVKAAGDQWLRATHADKESLFVKWQTRSAFDHWRRRFTRINRVIFERLHRTATCQKGNRASMLKRHAVGVWRDVCDIRKRRQIAQLQQVADMRLSMLMSGMAEGADPHCAMRRLAVRWRLPHLYKTFHAWRITYASTACRAHTRTTARILRREPLRWCFFVRARQYVRVLSSSCHRLMPARRSEHTWDS